MKKEDQRDRMMALVDKMGLAITGDQAPHMIGRVLGWLLLNSPQPQSAEDLAEALQASRGAISMSTRTLLNVGLIARRRYPADRKIYYEVLPETLARSITARFSSITHIRHAVEEGIGLLADEPPERTRTLRYIREMYLFIETEILRVMQDWEKRSAEFEN